MSCRGGVGGGVGLVTGGGRGKNRIARAWNWPKVGGGIFVDGLVGHGDELRVNLSGVCGDRAIRDDEKAVGMLGSLGKIGKENDARAAGT